MGAVAEVGVEVPPHGEQHVEAAGTVNTVEAHHEKEGGGAGGIVLLASVGAVAEVGIEVPCVQHVEAAGDENTVEAHHEKEGGGAGIVMWASEVAPNGEQQALEGAVMMAPMMLMLKEKYFGARIAMMPNSAQHRHHLHHMMGMRMGSSGRRDIGWGSTKSLEDMLRGNAGEW